MPKPEKCPVNECGAVVIRLQVEGETIAVNPKPAPVIVEEADRVRRRVLEYQPHWMTRVDIQGRLTRGRQPWGLKPGWAPVASGESRGIVENHGKSREFLCSRTSCFPHCEGPEQMKEWA